MIAAGRGGAAGADRHRCAAAREAERDRLRDLFAQAPGAIAVLRGPQHEFYIANEAYFELSGRNRDILNRPIAEALPEVVEQGFVALLDKVYESGEPFIGFNVPVELVRKGERQTRIVDFIYHPTRDLEGRIDGIFVQATDVTDRSRAEAALQELNTTLEQRVVAEVGERMRAEEQLRQAHKMDAIGQLTGGIAHDFNNMLAIVMSSITLSKRRLDRGETGVAPMLDAAMDAAGRAAKLTARLLAFSRQQPLQPEPIDANRFMAGITELLQRTLGERIEIETVLGGGLWKIHADASELENAVLNLAVNARDAMENGGHLTLETANIYLDDEYARTHVDIAPGQYVMIAVSDSGEGMSPQVLEKAFDPFFTTKPVGSGTGLGLSQVLGFVKQSGGHVNIYSEVGRGTTVKIYLPRFVGQKADDPKPAAIVAAPAAEIVAGVILVVEDEHRLREVTCAGLRELGYAVVDAPNGAEALKVLDTTPDITCLFTDIVMPGMTGRQLSDEALKRRPDLKVLYTTGYTRNAVVHNGVLDPGVNFLPKPFTVEQLALKIRQVLAAAPSPERAR